MESSIVYGTAGAMELLIAVPEHKEPLMGGYYWNFPTTPGIKTTALGTYKTPHPTTLFESVRVYKVSLETQHAIQNFDMVQGGVHAPAPLVHGRASLWSHPVSRTSNVNATMPVGGVDNLPVLIALVDQSGSTGYHWEQTPAQVPGLKVESMVFPALNQIAGAPATRVFALTATENGQYHLQLQLLPPGGKKMPVSTVAISFTAF